MVRWRVNYIGKVLRTLAAVVPRIDSKREN